MESPRPRFGGPSRAEVEALAATLSGLSFAEAQRRAHEASCFLDDVSAAGFYTQELNRSRIRVVLADGVILSATAG